MFRYSLTGIVKNFMVHVYCGQGCPSQLLLSSC